MHPSSWQLNRTYTYNELIGKLQLASDDIKSTLTYMKTHDIKSRIVIVYDGRNMKTAFKHPLITLTKHPNDDTWEGIMTVSTMGNTQPISIHRKRFNVKYDVGSCETSIIELKE